MFKLNKQNQMIIIGAILLLIVAGFGYYYYKNKNNTYSQCNLSSNQSATVCSEGCPSFGANKDCKKSGMDEALLQKPYEPAPHRCNESSMRNSPSTIPSLSPWVKDMYGPAPPIPGCNTPAGSNIDQAFNSCGNIVVDPTSPIGLSLEKCSPQPGNPESCLFPHIDN